MKSRGLVDFARFGASCILVNDGVREKRKSSLESNIISCAVAGEVPDPRWLVVRFPDATEQFRQFAEIRNLLEEEWPPEKVKAFWLAHRGWRNVSSCATRVGIISYSLEDLVYIDFVGHRAPPISNKFKLPCKSGHFGLCHQGFLCMEMETSPF